MLNIQKSAEVIVHKLLQQLAEGLNIRKARTFMQEGCRVVVDLDLEKFFDRVHHDRLMAS
jgi:hypothetical protein